MKLVLLSIAVIMLSACAPKKAEAKKDYYSPDEQNAHAKEAHKNF